MATIKLFHVAGYSNVDNFGQEILERVRINAGTTEFRTLKEARAQVKAAKAEMPSAMHAAGAPRIDAEREDGRVLAWL